MWAIIGKMAGQQAEEVDRFHTSEEAVAMLREYVLAFGPSWTLWIVDLEEEDGP